MPVYESAEDAPPQQSVRSNHVPGPSSSAGGGMLGKTSPGGSVWQGIKNIGSGLGKIGIGLGKAALRYGGSVGAGIIRSAIPGGNQVMNWALPKAQALVNKMDKGIVKTTLRNVIKGANGSPIFGHAGTNAPGPIPGAHREDRPLQGTAGKHHHQKQNENYYGTSPSNGTRNAGAVLNNSISGGYGERESASKNPRHHEPLISNNYVAHTAKSLQHKKKKRKHKKRVAW